MYDERRKSQCELSPAKLANEIFRAKEDQVKRSLSTHNRAKI